MKDILEVQNEINSIQEDIEAAGGRVNYLTHAAAYSTINLTYYEYAANQPTDTDENGFAFKVKEAFRSSIKIFESIVLIIINIWPLILGIIVALFIWKRKQTNTPKTYRSINRCRHQCRKRFENFS